MTCPRGHGNFTRSGRCWQCSRDERNAPLRTARETEKARRIAREPRAKCQAHGCAEPVRHTDARGCLLHWPRFEGVWGVEHYAQRREEVAW
jgi:hypothetical protein